MRKLLGLILFIVSCHANAGAWLGNNAYFNTPDAACTSLLGIYNPFTTFDFFSGSSVSGDCYGHYTGGSPDYFGHINYNSSASAPAPAACTDLQLIKPGGCSCNAPGSAYSVPSGPQICAFGRGGCAQGQHIDSSGGVNQCVNDCKAGYVELSNGVCSPKLVCAPYEVSQADGSCKAVGPVDTPPIVCPSSTHQVGSSCAPNNSPLSDPCPAGTHNIASDSSSPNCTNGAPPATPAYTRSGEVTNSDGSKVQTSTSYSTTVNADNSTTTTTTTTVTNISSSGVAASPLTTTETKTVPASNAANAPNNPDKPKDFCALHPELTSCKNSTVSGACGTLVCSGDAIQCAVLAEAQKTACDFAQDSAVKSLGQKLIAGVDPMAGALPSASNASSIDLGATSQNLDASPFLGGGACLPDSQVSLAGHSFAIPWSKTCDGLAALRMAVMFAAYLAAYRLLARVTLESI